MALDKKQAEAAAKKQIEALNAFKEASQNSLVIIPTQEQLVKQAMASTQPYMSTSVYLTANGDINHSFYITNPTSVSYGTDPWISAIAITIFYGGALYGVTAPQAISGRDTTLPYKTISGIVVPANDTTCFQITQTVDPEALADTITYRTYSSGVNDNVKRGYLAANYAAWTLTKDPNTGVATVNEFARSTDLARLALEY